MHRNILALARCPGTIELKERRHLGTSAHEEPRFNYLAVVSYEGTEYSGFQVSDRLQRALGLLWRAAPHLQNTLKAISAELGNRCAEFCSSHAAAEAARQ